MWVPALPQFTGSYVDREIPVPRWWLARAREGPFLAERSPESIHFLGARVCLQKYYLSHVGLCSACGGLWPAPHHPRFVEWIGVPQSAGLIAISGGQWVDKLSRDQAVTAAVHLQRDVGLMQTNVDVLDQYALSLQKAASSMIDICLSPCRYNVISTAIPDISGWSACFQKSRVTVHAGNAFETLSKSIVSEPLCFSLK